MKQTTITRIKICNAALFFISWMAIIASLSSWPPQAGIYWMFLLILILSVFLYIYLQEFLLEMINRSSGLFRRNVFVFVFIGVSISLLSAVVLINIGPEVVPFDILVWVGFLFLLALMNGMIFYIFNKIIVYRFSKRQNGPAK
ncbi:hypothetical protein [Saccharibacillus sacchari]|uniref:hypothetical protein n=1 Tax=Saccharibacillus sacchari TaxID=456493 RepID=UPI00056D308A|nr:hypothetical protein [Saccharibacillus sacchari]